MGFPFGEQSIFPIHIFAGSRVFPCLGSQLGKCQSWQGCQNLTTRLPRGDLSSITLTWRKRATFFTHGSSRSSPSRTGSRIFPHARRKLISSRGISIRGAIYFSHSHFCRFYSFSHVGEFNWEKLNGWALCLVDFLLFILTTQLRQPVFMLHNEWEKRPMIFLGCC